MIDDDHEDADGGPPPETKSTRLARMLGFAGLIPFVCLALWLYGIAPDHAWRQGTITLLLAYGAAILSFLGGARWGVAMSREREDAGLDYALAMAPPLIGWVAVVTPVPYAFALLAAAFAAQGAWDTLAEYQGKAPRWYAKLRTTLTVVVVASMLVALAATA